MQASRFVNKTATGYITLLAVIMFGAIALSATVSVLLLGLSSTQTSSLAESSAHALAGAQTCAEVALDALANTMSYAGSATIPITNGTCQYNVVGSGATRTITVTSTVKNATKKISITTSAVSPTITIASWWEW